MKEPIVYSAGQCIDNAATGLRASVIICEQRAKKKNVASAMGISPSYLSELLSGKRVWTDAMVTSFRKAIKSKAAK